MIWFFSRDCAQVDIEVRRVADPDGFELVVDYPDGSEAIERFTNARKLVQRTLHLQERLIRDGWVPYGPGTRVRAGSVPPAARPTSRRRTGRLWTFVQRRVTARVLATLGL